MPAHGGASGAQSVQRVSVGHAGRPCGCGRGCGRGRGFSRNANKMDDIAWKWENVNHRNDNDNENDNNNIVDLERFPFLEKEGLRVRMKDDPTVLDFVELYLTQEVFTLLITETNQFAKQYISSVDETVRNNSYVGKWKPVTVPEMKKFIGLIMLMGIVYKPTIHMYNFFRCNE